MKDPVYDKDLVEKNLGCAIKRARFMVSNDLKALRVCWPQKSFPFAPDSPTVKEDLK